MQLKPRFQSEDVSDATDHVYLKTSWVITSMRHPALRLLCCLLHLVLSVYVGVSSPLLTSLKTPASFPVYGDLVRTATTGFTWQKLLFQSALSTAVILLLRLVAYPRLVQHQWNWEISYHRATRTFSRLSRTPQADDSEGSSQSTPNNPPGVISVHTFISGGDPAVPAVRLQVWNIGSSHGSWTLVTATFPFVWAAVVLFVRYLAHLVPKSKEMLFPEYEIETWTDLCQLKLQKTLSTTLVVLSCLKLFVTLDLALQDRDYNRMLFGNWLHSVRRVYNTFPAVRILCCWLCLTGLAVGGIYFGVISKLLAEWTMVNALSSGSSEDLLLSNTSWLVFLSSFLVGLDLLWIVLDFEFPSFASPLGSRIFGLTVDKVTMRTPFRSRLSFTSKWLSVFIVLAVLLPLEVCQILQFSAYSPGKYEQYVNSTTYRVHPLDSSFNQSLDTDAYRLDNTSRSLLEIGSYFRYFSWSEWDRFPAVIVLVLGVIAFFWLWKKEHCKMCYSVFLGLIEDQNNKAKTSVNLIRKIPASTKHVLNTQARLRKLYKLRTRSDSFCVTLAGLSAVTVWLQFRAIWRSSAKYHRNLPLQSPGETYAALLLLITLILLHQVFYRYCVKLEIMVLRNQISQDRPYSILREPWLLLLPLVIELLLCGIFLPPLIHGRVYLEEERYSLLQATLRIAPGCPVHLLMTPDHHSCDLQYSYPIEIVNVIVLVRIYWFARVIRNQLLKKLVGSKATVSTRLMLTARNVPLDSLWWNFRVYFALRPSKVLLTFFALLWMSVAAAVSIFERPFPSKLDGEDHALWLTLVTMTGVGYGDAYPITTSGRMAIVLGSVAGGLIFLSLMTTEFLESLKGTKREHAVLSAMDTMKRERALRACSVQLICAAWKRYCCLHHRLYREHSSAKKSKQHQRLEVDRQLVRAAYHFKLCRKRKPMQSSNIAHTLRVSKALVSFSRKMEDWITSTQTESSAHLESLEKQMDTLTKSLQPLLL